MPSIEQCETSSALPSTMELFDKFKVLSSVSENGKDSDSEESFHLPLDDDDMENQSVVSNGRDKEIHNEETEDDILNKFETVPSGTPENLDSHIEDSILDDDIVTDKENDGRENCSVGEASKECRDSCDNTKAIVESATHIEEDLQTINSTKVEVKLTYDFEEYEDSGDGEFRSIYETDEVANKSSVERKVEDSSKPADNVEPMEVAEESGSVEFVSEEIKERQNVLQNAEALDNFDDSMEVEQEDTNQDIASIIEKLEDQDAPMQDVESPALNEGDVNMTETCNNTMLPGGNIKNNDTVLDSNKDIPGKEVGLVEGSNEDIDMIGDCQIDDEPQESGKENLDRVETNELTEVAPTFQEPLEASEDAAEAGSGEAEEQNIINDTEALCDNKEEGLDSEKRVQDEAVLEKTENDQTAIDDKKDDSRIKAQNLIDTDDSETENEPERTDVVEKEMPTRDEDGTSEIVQEELSNEGAELGSTQNKTEKCLTDKPSNDNEVKALDDLIEPANNKILAKAQLDLDGDDLLKQLEKTINESETDEKAEKATEGGTTEALKEPEMSETEALTDKKDAEGDEVKLDNVENRPEDDEKEPEAVKDKSKNVEKEPVRSEKKSETIEKAPEVVEKEPESVEEESESVDKEPENAPSIDKNVFKAPVVMPKAFDVVSAPKEEKEGPDFQNEKSNDKTDEDESDLLDISMVRETEEDDACAIADALNDKDAQISEKSDEEQSEKVETEQEGSDVDKDNDNDPIDFDDTDDDSTTEGVDHDDSSNAESTKDKIINISESSKDSIGESAPKRRKKTVDSYTDASNDGVTEASAAESGEESEKMDIPDSLVPDTSLSLESTLVQSEAASSVGENDDSVSAMSSESEAKNKEAEIDKTDENTEKDKEMSLINKEPTDDSLPAQPKSTEDVSERRKLQVNKRTFSTTDIEGTEIFAKKPKLALTVATEANTQKETAEKAPSSTKKPVEKDSSKDTGEVNEKVKTLTGFSKFMQCRQFTAKLSRSDLEQFCIQKICESLMLRSSEGEMHQTIKKHEKTIDFLRKDMQQLTKQCKDLEIVNKKLMNELRNQNQQKKPLVPLKITRSVGLQVRLNPGNETTNQNRRRQLNSTTPQKQVVSNTTTPVINRLKVTTGNVQQSAARQVLQNSPQKSPLTTGQPTTNTASASNVILSQALQQQKPRQPPAVTAKRTTVPARKPPEAPKPAAGNPGVIDLTDEDDRLAATKTVAGSTIKIMNKTVSPAGTQNKTLINKTVPGKAMTNQGKQVGVQKTVTVGQKGTALSQGIRLTPASVITSSANGSPQMVYVVPTIASNAGGTQKVAFVNFQPSNGVLSGINGSTVSVMSNKGQTLTLKTVPSPMRHNKHPAPLPAPPRITADAKLKPLLPKPHLTIKKIDTGIILQWKMPYNLEQYESIASYQLYAYQETSSAPSTDMWRKVGDVKALALPMACTLTQFADKNKYYFAVRSVDVHKRIGAFSDPEEISL